ncbi:MAG: preprotein translocase subunit YajC [Novosphingobium sp.]
MSDFSRVWVGIAALAASLVPFAASAQTLAYGDVDSGSEAGGGDAKDSARSDQSRGARHHGGRHNSHISPYIEARQVVSAELSPGNEVLTYSELAAGVEASVIGRNNAVSASLRYERRIGWGKASDGDTISGLLRGYAAIVPQTLQIDAGVLATRTRLEDGGAAVLAALGDRNSSVQMYSAYAGPTLSTHMGEAKVDAHYRLGYTKIESPNRIVTAPGQPPFDVFDKSVSHDAGIHIGTRPGTVLPVGIAAGANYYREDISNLDQRIDDFNARLDVTVPLSRDLALAGSVGYENVKISNRDAVVDSNGLPVIAGNRFVTDKSSPRQIAYHAEGLIWDAGVIWRPSRRTQLEAHVGRRYGTMSYYGSFSYAPNERSAFNVSVYDSIAGFGGRLNQALADLPAEFTANRNPLTGDLTGCVASLEKGNCLTGVLGSVRSATFRDRGVVASYALQLGNISAGIAGGYDRRKFIAAPGTVLAVANGLIDENYWVSGNLNGRIDRSSGYAVNIYANWFHSGSAFVGDSSGLGATLSYYRELTDHLEATAAAGLDNISRDDPLPDQTTLSALVGLRYSF